MHVSTQVFLSEASETVSRKQPIAKLTMAELETFEPPLVRTGSWFKIVKMVKYKDAWFPVDQFPAQQFDAIRNFPLDDNDILIASYPKSGCSFASNSATILRHTLCPNMKLLGQSSSVRIRNFTYKIGMCST